MRRGRKTGVDVLAVHAEPHGTRRTSAKLKGNRAVISQPVGGQIVSFAFFSAIRWASAKLEGPPTVKSSRWVRQMHAVAA